MSRTSINPRCPITGCTITAPHRHEVIYLDEPIQISPESYGCSKCNKVWPIGGAHLCISDTRVTSSGEGS